MKPRSIMKPLQIEGFEFVRDNKLSALFALMGTGKTAIILTLIKDLIDSFDIGYTLIVAPKNVTIMTWPNEILGWEHTCNLSFVTRDDLMSVKQSKDPEFKNAKKEFARLMQLLKKYPKDKGVKSRLQAASKTMRDHQYNAIKSFNKRVYLINVENYIWLVDVMRTRWMFDTVIFDESSLFRNPSSKRFMAHKKVMPYINRCHLLSGTPTPNGLLNLWSQMYMLDKGKRLERTFTKYKENYFMSDFMGYTFTLLPNANEKIHSKISDITLSIKPQDYMKLGPEPIITDTIIQMPKSITSKYKELEREFYLEINKTEVTAMTAGVLSNKLRQFCNGALYNDDRATVDVHSLKIQVLKELAESLIGNPLIVAYEYKHDKARILKAFKKAITIDQLDQSKWDNGEYEMLVIHPASGGHGLNLQHGGHHVIWYGITWNLEHYQQLNERIGQIRQTQSGYNRPPIYNRIYIKNTIEETIIETLNNKSATQADLLNAVKSKSVL